MTPIKTKHVPISGRIFISLASVLFLATSWILFCHLGTAHLWNAEGRVGEVVREMFVRGDFMHPTSGWQPHVSKPLIPYWLAVVATKLHGTLDEWSLRLPSAIAGVMAVISTVLLGLRLFSPVVGLTAGTILVSSLGFALWGRCAAADMLSLAGIIMSVTWYWWWRDRPTPFAALLFGLLVALAAQMKGLVGMAVPLIVISIDIIATRRYRSLIRPFIILAFLLGIGTYLIPFMLSSSTAETQGFNWISRAVHESIGRFIHPFNYASPLWTYVYFVPIWVLPWTPLFLYALISGLRDIKKVSYEQRWLLISIAAIFFFFTMSRSRRSYYILPILPFCAILTGQAVICLIERIKRLDIGQKIAVWLQIGLFALLASGYIGSNIFFHHLIRSLRLPQDLSWMLLISGGAILPFVLVAIWNMIQRRPSWTLLIALLGAGIMTTGSLFCLDKPVLDVISAEKPFVLDVKAWIERHPDAVPAYYCVGAHRRPRLSFYLDQKGPVSVLRDSEDLKAFMSLHPSWVIICMKEDEKGLITSLRLAGAHYRQVILEKIYPWQGYPGREDLEQEKRYIAYCP